MFAITSPVSAGSRLVLALSEKNYDNPLVSSVSDSKGNTWNIDKGLLMWGYDNTALISSRITTPLTTGDTITINYNGTGYFQDLGVLILINNANGVDTSYSGAATSTAVGLAGTISHSPAILIGLVLVQGGTYTSTWTQSGSTFGYCATSLIYTLSPSAGSYSPGGTINALESWDVIWAAYY
jgi:hypothetical protein